jgi:hypothetical protein
MKVAWQFIATEGQKTGSVPEGTVCLGLRGTFFELEWSMHHAAPVHTVPSGTDLIWTNSRQ